MKILKKIFLTTVALIGLADGAKPRPQQTGAAALWEFLRVAHKQRAPL